MTTNLLYAVGTILAWTGWFFAFRTVLNLFHLGMERRRDLAAACVGSGIVASLCLLTAVALPTGSEVAGGFRLPLFWPVMPWTAWTALVFVSAVAVRVIQTALAFTPQEQWSKVKSAVTFSAATGVTTGLFLRDPERKIEILKGGIVLRPETVVALILALIATAGVMVLAGRATIARRFAKAVTIQAALLAGCVVFGLPFAFLVITSFKEDRDMSSANGIVWVPRVQETVPFFDRKNPLYEGDLEGQRVQGEAIERNDGLIRINVQRPMAMQGMTFEAPASKLKQVPRQAPVVSAVWEGSPIEGYVTESLPDGRKRISITEPLARKGRVATLPAASLEPVRHVGLRVQNYPDALEYLPAGTNRGLVYLRNTLLIVALCVLGTTLSSSLVAYGFARIRFPGRNTLFALLLCTMMLPGAVTLMPQFLIFRWLGWIDTLMPLWVPAFFGSAFNVFLLRQFFSQIPMEFEDAAKIDGCGYLRTYWSVMLPQIKPALAVIGIWTFMAAWNNFMGPLIYVNSPENMPLSYAVRLFKGDRGAEPGLLMAFATLTMLPDLLLFFLCQRFFVEGVTLSGLGGR